MNTEQRDKLLELHEEALIAWGNAEVARDYWEEASDANKAFTDYLSSIEDTK